MVSDGAVSFAVDGGAPPICLRISSGEGIPGVGVGPFFGPFFISSGLGMPGVGVAPFGMFAITVGIPGAATFVFDAVELTIEFTVAD